VTVARAKRTARAEARRRYRAEHSLTDESELLDDEPATGTEADQRSAAAGRPAPGAVPRVGIFTAFRQAFRPLDLRADLAALPFLAVRTKALWLPILLVIGTTVALGLTNGRDVVTQFMFAYFVQTPAIGGVFLAGFLAPRASWLLGAIVGFVSGICYAILISALPRFVEVTSTNPGEARDAIVAGLILSPIMGAFFAAAAAWYRRFLQLSNPNRGRRVQGKPRRGDGRARTAGSRKEPARR
jgi:hypothetical protein